MKLTSLEEKIVGVGFDYNKQRRFNDVFKVAVAIVNTLLALWSIDRYNNQIQAVNGETYLVSEYVIDKRFLGFLGPRRVRLLNDGVASNLVTYDSEYEALSPSEYRTYQEGLLNAFRTQLNPATEDEIFERIGDAELLTVLDRVFSTSNGRRVEQNGPYTKADAWPIDLSLIDRLYNDEAFVMRRDEYIREMVDNIATSLRSTP